MNCISIWLNQLLSLNILDWKRVEIIFCAKGIHYGSHVVVFLPFRPIDDFTFFLFCVIIFQFLESSVYRSIWFDKSLIDLVICVLKPHWFNLSYLFLKFRWLFLLYKRCTPTIWVLSHVIHSVGRTLLFAIFNFQFHFFLHDLLCFNLHRRRKPCCLLRFLQ